MVVFMVIVLFGLIDFFGVLLNIFCINVCIWMEKKMLKIFWLIVKYFYWLLKKWKIMYVKSY